MQSTSSGKMEGGLRTKGVIKKKEPGFDLISVITIVYNNVEMIEKTIKSLLGQGYPSIEYIVIDGGSTDGTVDIIQKYEHGIDYFLSEKDQGIYYAMNKGLRKSSGKWVYFLNCGDFFYASDVLSSIKPYLSGDASIIHFNCSVRDSRGNEINVRRFPNQVHQLRKWPCIQHQSVFCKRSLMEDLSGFDIRWKLLGDYDFFVRAYLREVKFEFYPELKVAIYNSEGVSAVPESISLLRNELKAIQIERFGNFNLILQMQLGFKRFLLLLPFGNVVESIARKIFFAKR